MFSATLLFAVIITCEILLGQNPVDGSRRDWCPKSAIVDLSGETLDSSGAVNKLSISFPRDKIRYDDDGRFGCMCDIRICVPFCCPLGGVASPNGCLEDKYTQFFRKAEGYSNAVQKFHAFVDDPCQLSYIENTPMKKYDKFSGDKTVDVLPKRSCLLRKVNSSEQLIGLCHQSIIEAIISKHINAWSFTFQSVRVLFMLVTLIVYSFTPDLKNLQGLLLRCYIGSELTLEALSYVSCIWNGGSTLPYQVFLWVTGIAVVYFTNAHAFWLTMISFDVWRKFRRFRSNRHANVKEHERATFLRYSICAWGGSIVTTSIQSGFLIWLDVADPFMKSTLYFVSLASLCSIALTFMICVFFPIFTFISTALTIRRQKNEIARAVNGVDRHRKDNTNKQWVNLYLALFTLMGCYQIFYIALFFWVNPTYIKFLEALGALHCLLTFLIFVWKDDVKRSFRIQVIKMLRKWGACRRPHATPDIENKNENL